MSIACSAGPPIDQVDDHVFLKTPPLSIMLCQDMIETIVVKSESVSTKNHHLEQSLFSFVSSANEDSICIFPFNIIVKLESPSSFVERISSSLIHFKPLSPLDANLIEESDGPPQKRLKATHDDFEGNETMEDVMHEVQTISELILATLDNDRV